MFVNIWCLHLLAKRLRLLLRLGVGFILLLVLYRETAGKLTAGRSVSVLLTYLSVGLLGVHTK